jgi:hypothetical protein
MRVHLETATNPFDASLETVMPAVQERFNGVTSMIQNVDTTMRRMEASVESKFTHIEAQMLTSMNGLNATVSLNTKALQAAARAVEAVTSGHIYVPHTYVHQTSLRHTYEHRVNENTHTTSPAPENNTTRQHDSPRQPPSMQYRVSQQFASLSLMWDEWHGIGGPDTLDKPVVGGFAQLEQTYKAKWRSALVPSQQRHITRIRLIMNGIKTMAQTSSMSNQSAMDLLEPEWTRRKKSVDAMVKYLQEGGFVKKAKARGRKKQGQPEEHEDNSNA